MQHRRLAYLCLQATTEGQASHAHVHEIIGGLKRRGWDVDLFEPAYAGSPPPGAPGRLAEFTRVQRRLVRALKDGGYDALYVRGHALAWPAARAARRLGVPVVQECNGPYEDFYMAWPPTRPLRPLIDLMTRTQFRDATARIAVTDELAAWIQRETGRGAEVIGNGANTAIFRPDAPMPAGLVLPDAFAVLFGALAPWQGIDVALDAVARPEWPADVSLVIVGDGIMRARVEAAAGRDERIVALGTLAYADVAGVVARAVCSLVLSDRPGEWGLSPLKMYESMACGVPLVVPDRPGSATTVVANECGIVVGPLSPEGVAQAVTDLQSDPERARVMGSNGRAAVESRFSWDARAAATLAVIERVSP